jgi:hypothetical protein
MLQSSFISRPPNVKISPDRIPEYAVVKQEEKGEGKRYGRSGAGERTVLMKRGNSLRIQASW